MTGHRHGLVVGKFYPPHQGHILLIAEAARHAEHVTVVVMASTLETIPLADRVAWLRETLADRPDVTVTGIPCDAPFDLDDPTVWTAQVALMQAAVTATRPAAPIDVVFSSEKYGDELAARLHAVHAPFDPDRIHMPISGTAVRADLARGWRHLPAPVRAGLATRVIVVGAESTGTTTLARDLADFYRNGDHPWGDTGWVPEYGRDYTWDKLAAARTVNPAAGMDDLVWTAEDFAAIAVEQTRLENQEARNGSPLTVCDTDAFATRLWERRYLGPDSRAAETAVPDLPPRVLYLLTMPDDVPFEQDGIRDGEHLRHDMTEWFVEELTAAGHSWIPVTGTREQRLKLAVRAINPLLTHRATFTPPLG